MKIQKVGNRGVLFTFDHLDKPPYNCVTNVYVIVGINNFIVCDTYLGNYYMKDIKKYLEINYGKKNYIVFNSHGHWDHIWGNSFFKDKKIYAHNKCREYIISESNAEIEQNADQFAKEEIEIVLPNTIFENKVVLEDEGLEFFYSPGHSEDSSSCYDRVDRTLFVGDNVDDPFPSYICWNDLNTYITTLRNYLTFNAKQIVQSHGPVTTNDVIKNNIEYLTKLKNNIKIEFNSPELKHRHEVNLEQLFKIKS